MAKVKIPPFTVIQDSREQLPYEFYTVEKVTNKETGEITSVRHPWNVQRAGLKTGDYSIAGFEEIFTVERKSLADFMGCIFTERFDNELKRMAEMPHKAIIIETDLTSAMRPENIGRDKIHPNCVLGKLVSYVLNYDVPPILVDSRQLGQATAMYMMRQFYEKYHKQELYSQRGFHDNY